MTNTKQIKKILSDLGEVVKDIEQKSGQPTQLIAIVGNDKYVVGDLRRRAGQYKLEMYDEYSVSRCYGELMREKNTFQELAGGYSSFDELCAIVRKSSSDCKLLASDGHELNIKRDEYGGSFVTLKDGTDKQSYIVGKIISPLIKEGEKVSVVELDIYGLPKNMVFFN